MDFSLLQYRHSEATRQPRRSEKMKIWEVTFNWNGENEVHNFWENAQSSVDKFIADMTKRGDLAFVGKKLIKVM